MGGLIIFAAISVPYLVLSDRDTESLTVFGIALGSAAIGFADDYEKVAKKNKKGISGKLRLLLEFGIAGGAMAYLFYSNTMSEDVRLHVQLPFTNFYEQGLVIPAWAYAVFGAFVVVGTANAVNLTDGLDGLATSVTKQPSCFSASRIVRSTVSISVPLFR